MSKIILFEYPRCHHRFHLIDLASFLKHFFTVTSYELSRKVSHARQIDDRAFNAIIFSQAFSNFVVKIKGFFSICQCLILTFTQRKLHVKQSILTCKTCHFDQRLLRSCKDRVPEFHLNTKSALSKLNLGQSLPDREGKRMTFLSSSVLLIRQRN